MDQNITFRISEEHKGELDTYAQLMDRDRSYLIKQAIENYLAIQRWHLKNIGFAIEEADQGDFATSEKVEEVLQHLTSL